MRIHYTFILVNQEVYCNMNDCGVLNVMLSTMIIQQSLANHCSYVPWKTSTVYNTKDLRKIEGNGSLSHC